MKLNKAERMEIAKLINALQVAQYMLQKDQSAREVREVWRASEKRATMLLYEKYGIRLAAFDVLFPDYGK